jgi:transcriptional regulator PpsR
MPAANLVQPDITLLLDLDGIIQKATLSASIGNEGLTDWVGRPWFDTVADGTSPKIRAIVEDARRSGVSAFRQVTQRFPSGAELPMEYTTVRLGGRSGLIAIGRSLQAVTELQSRLVAAQHAREHDYWKLREVETRYRLLFDATAEPVLLIAVESLRVVEANPAALRALGLAPGWEFLPEVAAPDVEPFQALLQRAREQGRTPGIVVHLGPNRAAWVVRASLLASEAGAVFLLQVTPAVLAPADGAAAGRNEPVSVEALMQRMPDAFVVIDSAGIIRRVNDAFLDQVQVGAEGAVLGQNLGRWLGTPGADIAALLAGVQKHRAVRLFPTRLRGEHDAEIEVEVSAAGGSDIRPRLIGVLIRDIGRRAAPAGLDNRPLSEELAGIVGQIGRTTLLQLVKETTAAVERHSIDAALALANGNRTVAADLLGLSRQSLYVKLSRYAYDGASHPVGVRSD